MLSKISRAAAAAGYSSLSRSAVAATAAARIPIRCTSTAAAVALARPAQPIAAVAAAAAIPHAHVASSNSQSSLRWLLLLGSSLLVGGLVLAEGSSGAAMCEATSTVPVLPSNGGSAADLFFNPPAPPHDSWNDSWDGLQNVPPSIDPKSGRPLLVTRHLIFIRHGQYVLPTAETAGQDPVLTELGHEQARLTGERLKSLGYDVSVIHVSSMARARQTAADIGASFPGVPLRVSPLLSEGVPCAHVPLHPTWRPDAESLVEDPPRIRTAFEKLVHRWREHDGIVIKSQSEWDAVRVARMKQDPNELTAAEGQTTAKAAAEQARNGGGKPAALVSTSAGTVDFGSTSSAPVSVSSRPPLYVDRYELVVCHGNVIRYSLLRALQLPVQAWLRLAIYNTGTSHLIIRPNGHVAMQNMGDTGHLPKEMITYS